MSVQEATTDLQGPFEVDNGLVRLRGGRCPHCAAVFCPARLVCDGCGHRGLEDVLLEPRGSIYTFTEVHQSTPEFRTPYFLVYVDFSENVRVMLPALGEETPKIGAAVEIVLAPGPRLVDEELEQGPHARMVTGTESERSGSNE
ncbi:MAG: Zn-ribbon domain-containing OB-fold protein [Acidimicrobiales bacterium]